MQDASHWVHIDNPDGLLQILTPSFALMDRNGADHRPATLEARRMLEKE